MDLFPILEEKDGYVVYREVDKVARVVGDEAAEAAADDAVPRAGHVAPLHLALDVRRDLALDAALLHRLQHPSGVSIAMEQPYPQDYQRIPTCEKQQSSPSSSAVDQNKAVNVSPREKIRGIL